LRAGWTEIRSWNQNAKTLVLILAEDLSSHGVRAGLIAENVSPGLTREHWKKLGRDYADMACCLRIALLFEGDI